MPAGPAPPNRQKLPGGELVSRRKGCPSAGTRRGGGGRGAAAWHSHHVYVVADGGRDAPVPFSRHLDTDPSASRPALVVEDLDAHGANPCRRRQRESLGGVDWPRSPWNADSTRGDAQGHERGRMRTHTLGCYQGPTSPPPLRFLETLRP